MVGGSEGWMRILPFYVAFILSFDEVGACINSACQAAANQLQDSASQRDERLLLHSSDLYSFVYCQLFLIK